MYLSKPVKISVGIATLIVFLIPIFLILFWGYMFFSMIPIANSNELPPDNFPFNSMDLFFNAWVPVVCTLNVLAYGLIGFYVFHTIKNNGISDVIRTIAILIIFIFPYLGMPLYYIMFILLPKPPNWTIKKEPAALTL